MGHKQINKINVIGDRVKHVSWICLTNFSVLGSCEHWNLFLDAINGMDFLDC